MRTLRLKGHKGRYVVEINSLDALQEEPHVIEHQGKPIAVITPLVQASLASARARPLDEQLAMQKEEIAAFRQMYPQLRKKYAGQVVAIYQRQVVATGRNRRDVLKQVWERFGPVPCYIERVDEVLPRKVRIPSAWKREQWK